MLPPYLPASAGSSFFKPSLVTHSVIGIIGLVDEATGSQQVRARDALQAFPDFLTDAQRLILDSHIDKVGKKIADLEELSNSINALRTKAVVTALESGNRGFRFC